MKKSNNNIDKALGGGKGDGPTLVADKNEHIDIMNALEEAYKEAVKNGFSGSRQEYQDSLSLGELKRIGAATGGLISGIRMQK
jgi:hypothetical protein